METGYDLCVAGAGSGGLGAAIAAARLGLRVLLVERGAWLGGTSTLGGVHVWESTAGATGVPREVYHRMRGRPNGAAISRQRSGWSRERPFGEWVCDESLSYEDTLRRSGITGESRRAVVFEPLALDRATREMLRGAGRTTLLTGWSLVGAERNEECRALAVDCERAGETLRFEAGAFIDATGDGVLCEMLGCEQMLGEDPKDRFDEPGAPEEASLRLNGVSHVYRIRRAGTRRVEPLPSGVEPGMCTSAAHISEYPNGDLNVNVLPTMSGEEYWQLGPEAAAAECARRTASHWHWMQTEHGFADWRRIWTAPVIGVRETRRTVGEYVLTERDVRSGLSHQGHDDAIAITDHAVDIHGPGGGLSELREPYGVPFRCLVPRDMRNVLVASRCASFSHIAASSCRLSRTMMQLGQAAGTACALAKRLMLDPAEVPPAVLRRRLAEQGVQLEWRPTFGPDEEART